MKTLIAIECRRKLNFIIRWIHYKHNYVYIFIFMLSFLILLFCIFTIVITVTTFTESRVTGYENRESSSSAPWRAAMAPVTFQATSPLTAGKRRCLSHIAIFATNHNIIITIQFAIRSICVTVCSFPLWTFPSSIDCARFRCKLTAWRN